MDAIVFGTFVKERRMMLELTQEALAQQLHVTAKAVSRWERGVGFPDIHTLEPLAQALDVSLLELMQSRVMQEQTVSSEEASTAMANTLAMMERANKAMRRSPFWKIYWFFTVIPVVFIQYVVQRHIDAPDIVATVHILGYFLLYLMSDLVRLMILQKQNPERSFISSRWPYLAATAAKFAGFLLIAFSCLLKYTRGTGPFLAVAGVGLLLAFGSWLCFEFWKDYPPEEG